MYFRAKTMNVKMDFFISPELIVRPFTTLSDELSHPKKKGGYNLISSVINERSLVLTYLFYYKTPNAMLPKYFNKLNFLPKAILLKMDSLITLLSRSD